MICQNTLHINPRLNTACYKMIHIIHMTSFALADQYIQATDQYNELYIVILCYWTVNILTENTNILINVGFIDQAASKNVFLGKK